MFVNWNSGHLFLYKVLSQNAQRRILINCAGVLFIISIKNHTDWLMPIRARVCNLSIQHNSERFVMEVLENSNFGVRFF